jgi:hypothetical protein
MSTSLYPAVAAYKDLGAGDMRWNRVVFAYFIDGWNYRTVGDFLSLRDDLFIDPEGNRTYLVARNRRYVGEVLDAELPPVLGYNFYLTVVDGEWGSGQPDYQLPAPINENDWLRVVDGRWASAAVEVVGPPTPYEIDEGYILAVLDGRWVKYDGDNFYLPSLTIITRNVRHAVTVSGYRWLARPVDRVSGHRDGTLLLEGAPTETLRGDGTWDSGAGDDYGKHTVGDLRRASRVGAAGHLPCDGRSLGAAGDYSDAKYAALFYALAPENVEWDDDLVYLPDMPGVEIMYATASRHPVNAVIPVGPASGSPYTVRLYSSPGAAPVYQSVEGGVEWFSRDGMVFCDVGGKTVERYAGYAASVSMPSDLTTGYYYVDSIDKDGNVSTTTMSITEEDVMRMDTAVVAGNFPSGCGPRAAAYRYQLSMVNGRPLHAPFYRETYGAAGTSVVNRHVDAANQTLWGASMFVYGFGDYAEPYITSPDAKVAKLLQQLKDMDSTNDLRDPPSFRRVPVPFELGRGSFWGGCVGRDGKIYMCPHSASFVLVIDPKTGHMARWGSLGKRKHKWAGGVATNDGRIIFMPFEATSFLVVDTVMRTVSEETFGLSFYELSNCRFAGATLTPDNRVQAMSVTGYKELEIDVARNRATLYDLTFAMRQITRTIVGGAVILVKKEHPVQFFKNAEWGPASGYEASSNMGYDRIDLPFFPGASEWGGTFLHASGGVGAVPCGHWTPEISVMGQPKHDDDRVIPINRKLLYWSLYSREWGDSGSIFGGGIAGDTASAMSESYRCGDYDYTDTFHNPPSDYGRYSAGRQRKSLSHDRVKYLGGVMAADGCNYLLPCGGYHPTVMVIGYAPTVYTGNKLPVASFRVSDPRYLHCRGGALGADGYIYSAAADGSVFFALNPRTRRVITVETGRAAMHREQTAWMGVVAGPDGWMYYPPFDANELLIVDPCVFCGKWPAEMSNYLNKF